MSVYKYSAPELSPELKALMADVQNIQGGIMNVWQQAENDLLKKVLTQYFGHEPTPEDCKRVSVVSGGDYMTELIKVDGMSIGKITRNYPTQGEQPFKASIQFSLLES